MLDAVHAILSKERANPLTRTRPQMTLETRSKLIAIARAAFGEHGFAAVALDDLTTAAGLTRGALYHHFESKLGLFAAVVDQIDDELDEAVEQATLDAGGGWPGFRAGCRAFLRAMTDADRQRIMLCDAPAAIPGFANRPRMQLCNAAMVESLAALMDEGVIRRTDPAALASLIAGAATSATGWAATSDRPVAALDAVGDALDRLLDGLECVLVGGG
jgi:AcrR family transcriptional regulator